MRRLLAIVAMALAIPSSAASVRFHEPGAPHFIGPPAVAPAALGNPLPDFTFTWDQPPSAKWSRVFTGLRGTNPSSGSVSQPGNCPVAPLVSVPLSQVVTVTTAGKRLVGTTNGGYLHALFDAADVSNCNALRSEFSGPKNAAGHSVENYCSTSAQFAECFANNEKQGDEAFYGVSFKVPASGGFSGCWDSCGILGIDSGNWQHHPSYGGIMTFDRNAGGLRMNARVGHFPSLSGSGQNDAIGTAGITDWQPIRPGTTGCSHTTNCNGTVLAVQLLGTGAPRPFTYDQWHDLVVHEVYQARTNGVLEVHHRVQGGAWELLYSDVAGSGALIQAAAHPTMQFNNQYGAPGENRSEVKGPSSFDFQLYRAKPHATQHIYNAGIVRRQSLAEALAVFP